MDHDLFGRAFHAIEVKDLMRSRRVAYLPADSTVRKASEVMVMLELGAIPVVIDGRLVGIFTERDAITAVLAKGRSPETTLLSEVMTQPVVTVARTTSAGEAGRLMYEHGFRHLPVVEGERVLGIVSLRDLFSYIVPRH